MKKFNVLIFSAGLLGFSFYGLYSNSYWVHLLINLNTSFIYARIGLVTVLLAYVFIPSLRLYTSRTLLCISGILLITLGVISLCLPYLLSHNNTYVLLGDSFTLVEAGILSIVLSAELSAQRSRFMTRCFYYVRSLPLNARPRILTYDPTRIRSDKKTRTTASV
jgi:hypothetical protein